MEVALSPTQKKEEVSPGAEQEERIPFHLGAHIKLRSTAGTGHKAQTTVVGILENVAILVEDPVFEGEERITGRVGGDIFCAFFHEGCLYKFKTRFGQVLIHDIVCIDYPKHFEAQQLRKHHRIKVNLEAESGIGQDKKLMNGTIIDISKSGCCFELPGLVPFELGMPVVLTFQLPNEELVEDLECTVMNMHHFKAGKKTSAGMSFTAPKPEIAKVRKFCEMCMYFKV
jgi:c-di-GMP-binding flagellar brake protein YcgR